jgi:hypothetical protein
MITLIVITLTNLLFVSLHKLFDGTFKSGPIVFIQGAPLRGSIEVVISFSLKRRNKEIKYIIFLKLKYKLLMRHFLVK